MSNGALSIDFDGGSFGLFASIKVPARVSSNNLPPRRKPKRGESLAAWRRPVSGATRVFHSIYFSAK
jgi:hypothetical protein